MEPAAAVHHSRPVAGTVGTSDLKIHTHTHTQGKKACLMWQREIFLRYIYIPSPSKQSNNIQESICSTLNVYEEENEPF